MSQYYVLTVRCFVLCTFLTSILPNCLMIDVLILRCRIWYDQSCHDKVHPHLLSCDWPPSCSNGMHAATIPSSVTFGQGSAGLLYNPIPLNCFIYPRAKTEPPTSSCADGFANFYSATYKVAPSSLTEHTIHAPLLGWRHRPHYFCINLIYIHFSFGKRQSHDHPTVILIHTSLPLAYHSRTLNLIFFASHLQPHPPSMPRINIRKPLGSF